MGILHNLIVKIRGDKTDLDSTLKGAEKSVSGFGGAVKKIGLAIGAAFSVAAIAAFTKNIIGLAAQTEGVKAAFDRLNDPALLQSLRTATRGTVSDLQLMQKAVQAQNFKIPLSQLATYFEFATKRAIQTGESVDYLVDSIITGIGRKSVLVMDNLGISAVQLQDEVKKTGDFATAAGNIIRSELTDMGDVADTTATKVASIKTAFENLKTGLGMSITESGWFHDLLNSIDSFGKKMQERGFWGAFVKNSKWAAIEAEKALYDVTREGIPTSLLTGPSAEVIGYKKTKISRAKGVSGAAIDNLKGPSGVSGLSSLAGLQVDDIKINEMTEALEWQQKAVGDLTAAFEGMFSNVTEGFDAMVDSLIKSLGRWVMELAAKAAVLALLNLIAPGSGIAVMAHKSLGGMIPLGGGSNMPGAGKMQFKIKGKDLVTSLNRSQ